MTSDMFWSYFAMPIGVAICFGPAMIVGLMQPTKLPEELPKQEKK